MRQPSRYRGALPRAAIRILILIVAQHAPNAQPRGPASGHGEKDWIGSEAEGQLTAPL